MLSLLESDTVSNIKGAIFWVILRAGIHLAILFLKSIVELFVFSKKINLPVFEFAI